MFQVLKVLTAGSTAVSAVPSKPLTEAPTLAGNETTLVAAVQVRFMCAERNGCPPCMMLLTLRISNVFDKVVYF